MLDERTRHNKQLEKEINTMKTKLDSCRCVIATGHAETSSVRERELPRTVSRQVLPSHVCNQKRYYRLVTGFAERKYKLSDQKLTKPLT